jgi:hypothetical protein
MGMTIIRDRYMGAVSETNCVSVFTNHPAVGGSKFGRIFCGLQTPFPSTAHRPDDSYGKSDYKGAHIQLRVFVCVCKKRGYKTFSFLEIRLGGKGVHFVTTSYVDSGPRQFPSLPSQRKYWHAKATSRSTIITIKLCVK